MILYGVDNIRDLFGHKVRHLSCASRLLVYLLMYRLSAYVR